MTWESCNCPVPDDQTKDNRETVALASLEHCESLQDGFRCEYAVTGTGLQVAQSVLFHSSGKFNDQENGVFVFAAPGQELVLEKLACIQTSRDADPRIAPPPAAWSYEALLEEHSVFWAQAWESRDFSPAALDSEEEPGLRYAIFQLMGSCSAKDPTVSIGARGLSHGRYKGCYFWDTDLFMAQ